ncbi:Gti1/Pac2 family-domain-containing protein [Peziza echinospora]|nr:Gti1/Pac2 family-domain-containing protein [Peziza echinospora]
METYHGHVRTPADAIILFEACRLGLLPRVQRRLSEKERQSIKSGSIFVWDEREAGMRRWTDGKSWSASRVSGSFLTYREMEGKRGGGSTFAPPVTAVSHSRKSPNADSDSDHMDVEGPDGYRYKPDGLMKQSFSITTANHQKLHLISYYARSSTGLMQPSQDPQLKHIRPAKGMYPESTVHEQQNVPIISQSNSSSGQRTQNTTAFHSHQNPLTQVAFRQTQSATHPHSYAPVGGSPYQQQHWLPSPTSTPPMAQAGIVPQQYSHQILPPVQQGQFTTSQNQLPHPLTAPNGHYLPQATQYDRIEGSPQQPHHSPMMHLRPTSQQPSPRMSQEQHSIPPRQQSVPPLDGMCSSTGPSPIRYSSPGASSHTSAHTPPRPSTNEHWEINPIRNSPDSIGRSPALQQIQQQSTTVSVGTLINGGEISPSLPLLDVQDIPSEKIFQGEDMRTLRMLDKAFVA